MDINEIRKEKKAEIIRIAKRYGASNIRLFGSLVRNDLNETSDIDVLITIERGRTLIDLFSIGEELEGILNRRVHIVADDGISPYLKDKILSEAIPL